MLVAREVTRYLNHLPEITAITKIVYLDPCTTALHYTIPLPYKRQYLDKCKWVYTGIQRIPLGRLAAAAPFCAFH